jgi:D-arabinose 1-dehydrogenase-like Zn-dependent alcohol dehydrogenase
MTQATIWGAIEKVIPDLETNDTVGIIGIGGLGYLGVQFVQALGFQAVAIDNRSVSLEELDNLPSKLQPSLIVNTTTPNPRDQIMAFTRGEGLAAVLVCAESPEVNNFALSLLKIRGTMVPLGLPAEGWRFDAWLTTLRELTIKGNYVTDAQSVKRMLEVVVEHDIRSHICTVAFTDIPKIVDMYTDKNFKGRLVVEIGH